MKMCVLGESPADEAAVRILVDRILGNPTFPIPGPALVSRGWTTAVAVLPVAIKHLHYHTDADALVVVLDSDETPIHEPAHDETGGHERCRICIVRKIVAETIPHLRQVAGRSVLKIAVGLAVPAIEAWYAFGAEKSVSTASEAAWIVGLSRSGKFPYTKPQLKKAVYGTDRPSLALETQCAIHAAQRLSNDLSQLEAFFPNGFGFLARQIRSWQIAS